LELLRSALADAATMFGDSSRLRSLFEDAHRTAAVSADKLSIVRTREGRASFQQGGTTFQILLGDETFDTLNYASLPQSSRPVALGLRNEVNSAKLTILHEIMHVVIDGQPDILINYRLQRQWGTQEIAVERGPQDGHRSFALANMTRETGPEEDLVIAMALYAYGYAPDAPHTHRLYLEVMYAFHMTFVWTVWELPEPAPGGAAEMAALEQSQRSGPECRIRTCSSP
jgi:hypothetical protein